MSAGKFGTIVNSIWPIAETRFQRSPWFQLLVNCHCKLGVSKEAAAVEAGEGRQTKAGKGVPKIVRD